VAPGSDATIRVASTNASSSFRVGNDVNITEDGSVTTTFDLSDQEVGDEFELVYQVAGSSADSADGVIVESVDTGEDETADEDEGTNETADGGEDTDDGESEPADDGEMNESTDGGDDGGSTDDGTPGFGAVVALVALIGAALLAVRRQN
jgi:PGF-CTERM protein